MMGGIPDGGMHLYRQGEYCVLEVELCGQLTPLLREPMSPATLFCETGGIRLYPHYPVRVEVKHGGRWVEVIRDYAEQFDHWVTDAGIKDCCKASSVVV